MSDKNKKKPEYDIEDLSEIVNAEPDDMDVLADAEEPEIVELPADALSLETLELPEEDLPEEELPEVLPEADLIPSEEDQVAHQIEFTDLFTAPEVTEEGEPKDQTLNYYNANADEYTERTISADLSGQYRFFEKYLPAGTRILDFGCGSGRDTKYFKDKGFIVSAIDGSEEMCKKAESYTGINVRQMDFLDLNDREIYTGIWANASLLHIPKKDLIRMFAKLRKALTRDGVLYVSFKEGSFEGMRDGRYYSDLTEGELFNLVNTVGGMKIVAAKPYTQETDEGEVKWISAIIKKW